MELLRKLEADVSAACANYARLMRQAALDQRSGLECASGGIVPCARCADDSPLSTPLSAGNAGFTSSDRDEPN